MALIGNRSVLHKSPGRFLSGTVASIERSNFSKAGMVASRFQSVSRIFGGIPSGHLSPSAWSLPRTAGALGAINETTANWTVGTLNLAAGRNVEGATSLTFTVPDAELQLVVSAIGATSITFSAAGNLAGSLAAQGSTSITFALPAPTLGAISDLLASVGITFAASATPRATGSLAGNITPFTELSPQSLASAVWERVIEAGFTAEEILRIIAAHAAGSATGLEGANPQFTGLDGATVRIDGAYSAGTRTIDNLDGS
jgi:hypothetical protein